MSSLLTLLAVALFAASVSCTVAPEKALAKHLLDSYEELGVVGRPVSKISDAVKVGLGFNLVKILKVEKGWITFHGYVELEWQDPFLAWDPKKFGGAESIALPSDDIWTPDITAYNDFHQNSDEQGDEMEEADVLVQHDGKIIWVPRMTYKTPCQEDSKAAGQLTCTLIFGSWVHDNTKISIEFDDNEADVDLDAYDATPGIQLVKHSAAKEDKEYECCPGVKYTTVTFTMVVKRTGNAAKKEEL